LRKYKGIGAGRLLFACLIPLLHIGFEYGVGIDLVRQYISRLGVPYFFSVSGMFLINSIRNRGHIEALKNMSVELDEYC